MQQIKLEPMMSFKYCQVELLNLEIYKTKLDTSKGEI
jgi:hypothetical protein